jgi:hypothetical protein
MDYKTVLLRHLEIQLLECAKKGMDIINMIRIIQLDYIPPPNNLHTYDPQFPPIDLSFLD